MSKFEGTPGPWKFEDESGYVAVRGQNGAGIFYESKWHVGAKDDAQLIAEAGTVLHETGLTPRQLASQRAELLEALRYLRRMANKDDIDHQYVDGLIALATESKS